MNRIYTFAFALILLVNFSYAQNRFLPLEGLIAWYSLDGNAADSSGMNNNGTATSVPVTLNRFGQAGKAAYFNGTSGSISIPNSGSLQPANNVSVAAWMKPDSISVEGAVMTKRSSLSSDPYQSYGIQYNPTMNKWYYAVSAGTPGSLTKLYTKATIAWGAWTFFVGTYDGTTMKLYINGVLDTSLTNTNGLGYGAVPMFIGYSGSGNNYYKGSIDEVSVHNRALTSAEVSGMFNGNVGIREKSMDIEFSVYPNPAENELNLNGQAYSQYTIADITGKVVASGAYTNHIDISTLHTGMYFIALTDEKGNTGIKHFIRN